MRLLLASLTVLLTAVLVAPSAAAVYQPPPICPACVPIIVILATCVLAEVNQDLFNDGTGCSGINQEQHVLECDVRSVEAQLGLAPAC